MKNKSAFLYAVSVAASSLLMGCFGDSDSDKASTTISRHLALILTSDYQAGALHWVATDDNSQALSSQNLAFNQDSKLVTAGSDLYVLERYGADNLVRLQVSKLPAASAVRYQVDLGEGANPSDLVIVNDTLGWLALTGRDYLLRFDPATGAASDSVDISAFNFSDSASSPDAVALVRYGDTLCLVMQRLNGWNPDAPGLVAFFDVMTGELLDTISLSGHNPQGVLLDGSSLLIPCEGPLMDASAPAETRSLDVVDLKTGSVSVLTTSTVLGGGPGAIALDVANRRLYVAVYRSWGDMPLSIVDVDNGHILQASVEGVEDVEGGMMFDSVSGNLWLGDRSTTMGGVKVWNGSSLRTVTNGDALPPLSIAIVNR